jgi:hypothetical protein
MDAPVDGVTAVYVKITAMWIKPHGHGPAVQLPMPNGPMTVNLIGLTDKNAAILVDGAAIKPGRYDWIEMDIAAERNVRDSYVITQTGAEQEIETDLGVPSGRMRLVGGFTVPESPAVKLLFDWDMRKGLHYERGRQQYSLKPAFRMLDVSGVADPGSGGGTGGDPGTGGTGGDTGGDPGTGGTGGDTGGDPGTGGTGGDTGGDPGTGGTGGDTGGDPGTGGTGGDTGGDPGTGGTTPPPGELQGTIAAIVVGTDTNSGVNACASDSVDLDVGNVVYVFSGGGVTPDDIDGTGDPIATVTATRNAVGDYVYHTLIAPGTYSVTFTCQAGNDDPVFDETGTSKEIVFLPEVDITNTGGVSIVDFSTPPPPPRPR